MALLTEEEMQAAQRFAKVGESWAYYVDLYEFGERFDRLYGGGTDALEGQVASEFIDELYYAYIHSSSFGPSGWRKILAAVLANRDRRIHFWIGNRL